MHLSQAKFVTCPDILLQLIVFKGPLSSRVFCGHNTVSDCLKVKFSRSRNMDPHGSRLVTMSPFYPCGKPCPTGSQNEAVKSWRYFCLCEWNYDGITASDLESRLRILVLRSNRKFYHISRNHSNSQISQSDYNSRKLGVQA